MIIAFIVFLIDRKKKNNILKYLNIALLSQTVIIALSALKRILLYIDAYGKTVLRFYVEHFIIYTMIVFFAFIIIIYLRKKLAFLVYFVAGLSVLYLMFFSLFNVEGHIAQVNVDRYLSGKGETLDISYLSKFSTDITEQMKIIEDEYNTHMEEGNCEVNFLSDTTISLHNRLTEEKQSLVCLEEEIATEGDTLIDLNNIFNNLVAELDGISITNWYEIDVLAETNPVHADKLRPAFANRNDKEEEINGLVKNFKVKKEELKQNIVRLDSRIADDKSIGLPNPSGICGWANEINSWKKKNTKRVLLKLDIFFDSSSNINKSVDDLPEEIEIDQHWVNLNYSDWKFISDKMYLQLGE
jgi:hypothetical protein